ncbi:MAG: hypothetical protein K2P79_13390 [Sphingomonas sp.]|nr:hypothetical protein [Sphingomonas sp.]
MKWTYLALIVAAALGDATLVHAAKSNANGSEEISRGDYAAAERLIERQRRLFAWDSGLTLNLATVYRHTDRADAARLLYERLLLQPDEPILGRGGTTSLHAVAQHELAALDVPSTL